MTFICRRLSAIIAHWLGLSVMVIMMAGLWGCGERGPQRLPDSGFQVAFESHNIPSDMPRGQIVYATITVKNMSPVTWPSKPDRKDRYAVNLAYHWLDRKGATIVFDGLRTPLPRDLKPGESVDLKATIQTPEKAGRYTLEVTLVQELAAWFPEKNGAKLVVPVTVFEAAAANSAPVTSPAAPVPVAVQSKEMPVVEKTAPAQRLAVARRQ